MDTARLVLKILHFVAWGALVGGVFTLPTLAQKRFPISAVWGARFAFVTGLLLVGIKEGIHSAGGEPVNHAKIGVKFLLAAIAVGLVEAGHKKDVKDASFWVLVFAILAAIIVAVLWK